MKLFPWPQLLRAHKKICNTTMSDFKRPQVSLTKSLPKPNPYVLALENDYKDYAFSEERVLGFKGKWHSDVFKVPHETYVDLEIGTGNGVHFQHYVASNPTRCLIGIELKYKPLIQTIRGALKAGNKNGRIMRFHGFNIDQIFAHSELSNVFIHFPDPWTSPRKPQNRMVNPRMLELLHNLQRTGSRLEFKTDSREYFLWAMEHVRKSKYKIVFETMDMHSTEYAKGKVITGFERIFLNKKTPINCVLLEKI